MGLFSFFRSRKGSKAASSTKDGHYLPFLWEDNYCQIEIVPKENREFIKNEIQQIAAFADKHRTAHGFTDMYLRKQLPNPTAAFELRLDYLERLLLAHGFERAEKINYNAEKIIDCREDKTKAFGFARFTLFIESEEELINNIWLEPGFGLPAHHAEQIMNALYSLGEETEFVLVDWNSLEWIDLTNRNAIGKYLSAFENG